MEDQENPSEAAARPRKRGPAPTYEKTKDYHRGAPRLACRISPEALEWIEAQPEGKRDFLERLVLEHKAQSCTKE